MKYLLTILFSVICLIGFSQPYTDNFESYTGSTLLAGQGNRVASLNNLYVQEGISKYVRAVSAPNIAGVYYNQYFDADQYSEVVWYYPNQYTYIGVGVRMSSNNFYGWYSDGVTRSRAFKIVSGVYTTLADGNAWITNDTVRIEADGTTLSYYRNGELDTSVDIDGKITDSDLSSGYAGLVGYNADFAPYIDYWEGGNVSSSGPTLPTGSYKHYIKDDGVYNEWRNYIGGNLMAHYITLTSSPLPEEFTILGQWGFEDHTIGTYTDAMAQAGFVEYNIYMHGDESQIVYDGAVQGNVAQTRIDIGETTGGDIQVNAYFDEAHTEYDEMYISYRVKCDYHAIEYLEGKIPGLRGMPGVSNPDDMLNTPLTYPIKIYETNPWYFEYKGEPVLLLGGSREDNLFNDYGKVENVEEHLDLLKSVGGNYLRNTMSNRDTGNIQPFLKIIGNKYIHHPDDVYDLDQWEPEYWHRLDTFLLMCKERDIIVQIEIWDDWDYFYDLDEIYGDGEVGWSCSPFNPDNNINYTASESGLPAVINSGRYYASGMFHATVPELDNNTVVLPYQDTLVKKILSYTLQYSNVLYCIDNETIMPEEWYDYWTDLVINYANDNGIVLTEMVNAQDILDPVSVAILEDSRYDFKDVSQNNHQLNQTHYNKIMSLRDTAEVYGVRPFTNTKVYGGTTSGGSINDGLERFWRNIFSGCASTRFHREVIVPTYYGIGLNMLAQTHIKSARMITDSLYIFSMEPDNSLLSNRSDDEAYCLAEEKSQYAVYFTNGGSVNLDGSAASGYFDLTWLDISNSQWGTTTQVQMGGSLLLEPPSSGHWAVMIKDPSL